MKLGDAEFEAAVERGDTVERTFAVRHDGTREHLSDRVHPANPEPGVVYDAHGLPDSYATALQRGRWEQERKAEAEKHRGRRTAMARKLRREERDRALGEAAMQLASTSDELADNPQAIARRLLGHWQAKYDRDGGEHPWGAPCALSTLKRVLAEQRVASRLRGRR